MKLRADSNFRPGSFAALEARVVPRLIKAVENASEVVVTEAKAICPVDTGALQDSIADQVKWEGTKVTGSVYAPMPYAAYVEFGTGIRGASSAGAGPYAYSPTWTGMAARPFLRPALDTSRGGILDAFKEQGFNV